MEVGVARPERSVAPSEPKLGVLTSLVRFEIAEENGELIAGAALDSIVFSYFELKNHTE